jgi:hypothetical protein
VTFAIDYSIRIYADDDAGKLDDISVVAALCIKNDG